MKTHVGNLTAQNPIGKYPPQIIVENPANLHSETVTTESLQSSSDLIKTPDASAAQPAVVYKYVSDTPGQSELGARMYTADETGTITLAEHTDQGISANQNFTMGISSHQSLATNISSNMISFEGSANLPEKSLSNPKLQEDTQNATQVLSQSFNTSLLNHSYISNTKVTIDENNDKPMIDDHNSETPREEHVLQNSNDLLIHYEKQEPARSEYSQVMTTVANGGVLALNPSDFGMDMSQIHIPLAQESSQEIDHLVQIDDTSTISTTLENGELEKKIMQENVSSSSQSVISEQRNSLHTEQILKCGNCGKEFTDLAKMKTHFEIHHKIEEKDPPPRKERHKCSKCTDVFANAQELKSHESTHVEEPKTYVCEICNAKFSSNSSYVRHQNVHNDKPFKCGHDGCFESYRTVGSLTKHNMAAHGGDPGQFNNAAFKKRTGAHIKLSEEQTKALAETPVELAKTISEKMLLSSAAEKIKADNPVQKEQVKEVHANQCDQCDVSFKKPSDLVRHKRTHTGEKPFGCDVCERRFAVKSTLRTHMKVHTGGKSLACHVCQSLFASRTSLKVHMRLHTGSLPYKCNLCPKRFRTPAHRKTHMNNHCKSSEESENKKEDMIPLTISAESLTAALEAVSSSGAPLIGATVQLQLHGHGFESAMTQLQIDEELLSQLRKGENINISINQMQLNQGKKKILEQQLQTLPNINLNGDQTRDTNEEQSNKTPSTTITSTHGTTEQSSDLISQTENETADILTQQHHSLVLPETSLLLSGTKQLILPLNQDASILRATSHNHSIMSSIEQSTELINMTSESQETISTVSDTLVTHGKQPVNMLGQSLLLTDSPIKKHTSSVSEGVIILPSEPQGDMMDGMTSKTSLLTTEREILVGDLENTTELNYSVSTDENGRILDIQPGGETQGSLEEKVLNLTVTQYENDPGENTGGPINLPMLEHMDVSQVYICPWCDRVFRTEKDRIEHLLTGHGVEVKEDVVTEVGVEEPGKNNTKEKTCSVCDKKFMKPSQLVRHMRVHTGERPFACLMCRKSFNQKNALQVIIQHYIFSNYLLSYFHIDSHEKAHWRATLYLSILSIRIHAKRQSEDSHTKKPCRNSSTICTKVYAK